jgi:hypothetical protein
MIKACNQDEESCNKHRIFIEEPRGKRTFRSQRTIWKNHTDMDIREAVKMLRG